MSEDLLKVIDLKSNDIDSVVSELLDASRHTGFFFVDGHDISQEEVNELLGLSKDFFKLPVSEKVKYTIDQSNRGYSSLLSEKLDLDAPEDAQGDPKEAWNFSKITFSDGVAHHDSLPDLFKEPQNEEIVKNINKKLYGVLCGILERLGKGLKIDKEAGGDQWFIDRHRPDEETGSTLRFLKYPSQKSFDSGNLVRAAPHTDYGTVTLLFQFEGQGGLEIYKDGWKRVSFVKSKYAGSAPPLVVNFGDQLSYWTAGVFKATIHQVKFPEESIKAGNDRYSIVFFAHPENNVLLEPIPSELTRGSQRGANTSKPITAVEHLAFKLNSTYKY